HTPPPPSSPHFPYTTLFRSRRGRRRPPEYEYREVAGRQYDVQPAAPADARVLRLGLRRSRFGAAARSETWPPFPVRHFRQKYVRSEEHTSELQSRFDLVCRL